MLMRLAPFVLVLLILGDSWAQDPAKPPAKSAPAASVEPAPGDKCLLDLPQWQQYANTLKASRDDLEQQLATLRAEVARLKAAADKPK
jgi:Skp family chaperone for outer membrane proteins